MMLRRGATLRVFEAPGVCVLLMTIRGALDGGIVLVSENRAAGTMIQSQPSSVMCFLRASYLPFTMPHSFCTLV